MSLPSPLSFPPSTPALVIPWDTVPYPILMVGKHILIDACVHVVNSNKEKKLEEQKSVIVILWLAWWLIYSETWTGILEPLWKLRKDTNGRWLIGNWGKWLLWYWYHHWCNVIEMVMRHNVFLLFIPFCVRVHGKMCRIYRNHNLFILHWDKICIDTLKCCHLYKRERC